MSKTKTSATLDVTQHQLGIIFRGFKGLAVQWGANRPGQPQNPEARHLHRLTTSINRLFQRAARQQNEQQENGQNLETPPAGRPPLFVLTVNPPELRLIEKVARIQVDLFMAKKPTPEDRLIAAVAVAEATRLEAAAMKLLRGAKPARPKAGGKSRRTRTELNK